MINLTNQVKSSSAWIVTIDGPLASGKSSVSREVARRLGCKWLSTGAFYRGLAYVAQQKRVLLSDVNALKALAGSGEWSVQMDEDRTRVTLDGKDVTDFIYREEVGTAASQISQYPEVRASLLEAQRNCAVGLVGLVAEGRDCGTVVFPQAHVKIYLTARSEDRAARRAKEQGLSLAETQAAQKQRDLQDSSRVAAPLQVPENAYVVDTSEMNLEQVVDKVVGLVRQELSL